MADRLDGYSGADLVGVCVKATDLPFHRQIRTGADAILTRDDLERAMIDVKPTVSAAMLERYRKFEER
jgi:SpoVK/Ycf46/Vps4 family AAA+-type ATPase